MMSLRHEWQEVRRNPLYAIIYIFGTAIALGSTTVMIAIINASLSPIYPEYQRDRTAYVSRVLVSDRNNYSSYQYSISYDAVRDYFYKLKNADKVTAYISPWSGVYAQTTIGDLDVPVQTFNIDPTFFDIFSFKFLAGRPISDAEFESGSPVAHDGDRTARKIFGAVKPEELIGKTLSLGFREFNIIGVVLEPTEAEAASYAGVYYPYTAVKDYDKPVQDVPFIGSFQVVMLADNIEGLRSEIHDIETRFNNSQDEYEVYFDNQPRTHVEKTLMPGFWYDDDSSKLKIMFLSFGLMLLGLLIVPSLNLSGLIAGRMETRVGEMGIRKSFGATRGVLLRQVLWENLILTAVGTVFGYFLAYALLNSGIGAAFGKSAEMSHGMLLAPAVFIGSALLCFLLNIISGLIPVRNSLRRPIVQSLNEK